MTRAIRTLPSKPRPHGFGAGVPDGMTIDAAGKLWVVLGESGCVVQYDPETGREMAAVRLPVKRPTACCFGAHGEGFSRGGKPLRRRRSAAPPCASLSEGGSADAALAEKETRRGAPQGGRT